MQGTCKEWREYAENVQGICREYGGNVHGGSMEGTCREYAGNMRGILREYERNMQGILREYAKHDEYVQGICRECAGNMQGTLWEYAGHMQGMLGEGERKYARNTRGICRECAGNMQGICRGMQGTFREYSGNMQGMLGEYAEHVHGMCRGYAGILGNTRVIWRVCAWNVQGISRGYIYIYIYIYIYMQGICREYAGSIDKCAGNMCGAPKGSLGSQGKPGLPVASRKLHAFAVPRLCPFLEKSVWEMLGICMEYAAGMQGVW